MFDLKKIHSGLQLLPGGTWGKGLLMMPLLPGSQAYEIDARGSLQLVKEQEVKIFRAYKLVAM